MLPQEEINELRQHRALPVHRPLEDWQRPEHSPRKEVARPPHRHEVEAGCGYEPARGNVILDVGGKPVADAGDVRNALSEAKSQGKHQILIRAKMGDATRFVALPLGNA